MISLEATGHCHRASSCSNNIHWKHLCHVFIVNTLKMGAKQNDPPPNNNGGMTYQTAGKLLSKMIGYFVGGGGYIASNFLIDWLTLSIT